jgi:hypothetical protein
LIASVIARQANLCKLLNTLSTIFLGKELLVLFEYEAGWSPEPVWTLEKREILAFAGIE